MYVNIVHVQDHYYCPYASKPYRIRSLIDLVSRSVRLDTTLTRSSEFTYSYLELP